MFKNWRFNREIRRIKRATKKANKLYEVTRRQHRVMKYGGAIRVFSSLQIKKMKEHSLLNIDALKLDELTIYKTPVYGASVQKNR
jgi:hypothetical protein